jgi:TetR/AcrR family transcriptional repressor of nem operon
MNGKKQEIIEATAELIRTNGYENTRLSDILEATGTGKGQFYYYFTSKKELGLAALDYTFGSFYRDMLRGILCSSKDPETKFDEMLKWIISFHRDKQAKCGCFFGNLALEMSEHDEAFREKLNDIFTVWKENLGMVFEEMFKPEGPSETEEVQNLAQSVVAMIEGGILLMKNKQDITVLRDVTGWIRYLVAAYASAHAIEGK